jgi:lysozyme
MADKSVGWTNVVDLPIDNSRRVFMTSESFPGEHQDDGTQWPINKTGVNLIKESERLRLTAYLCPAGVATIGYGHTRGVRMGGRISEPEANTLLAEDLEDVCIKVMEMCTVSPNENQLAALVSFGFNCGTEGLKGSTVLRAHNQGNVQAAGRAFNLWNKARVNGRLVVLPGLVARRAKEAALYLTAAQESDKTPMPQAVAEEVALTSSRTIKGAVGGMAAGSAGVFAQFLEAFKDVKDALGGLEQLYPWLMTLALVGTLAYVIYARTDDRNEGWK